MVVQRCEYLLIDLIDVVLDGLLCMLLIDPFQVVRKDVLRGDSTTTSSTWMDPLRRRKPTRCRERW